MSPEVERRLLKAWDEAHDLMAAWENASQEARKAFLAFLATDYAHEAIDYTDEGKP